MPLVLTIKLTRRTDPQRAAKTAAPVFEQPRNQRRQRFKYTVLAMGGIIAIALDLVLDLVLVGPHTDRIRTDGAKRRPRLARNLGNLK